MPHTVTQDNAMFPYKMMQHAHLASSEAFDVQLENAGPLELVDGAPKMRIAPS